MRKYSFGFGLACCVAAVAMLGGCKKNEDGCCGKCKDKAEVKTEATATPAGSKCCSEKAAGCSSSCAGKKACTGAKN